MPMLCPDCHAEIEERNFNISTDVAYCPLCRKNYSCRELLKADASTPRLSELRCPRRVRLITDGIDERLLCRNFAPAGFFLLFFALLWNGFLLARFLLPLGTGNGESAQPDDLSCLFLSPFVLIGIGVLAGALYLLCGKAEVAERNGRFSFFHGVGPIGIRRTFSAEEVEKFDWERQMHVDSEKNTSHDCLITARLRDGGTRNLRLPDDPEAARYVCAYLQQKLR